MVNKYICKVFQDTEIIQEIYFSGEDLSFNLHPLKGSLNFISFLKNIYEDEEKQNSTLIDLANRLNSLSENYSIIKFYTISEENKENLFFFTNKIENISLRISSRDTEQDSLHSDFPFIETLEIN